MSSIPDNAPAKKRSCLEVICEKWVETQPSQIITTDAQWLDTKYIPQVPIVERQELARSTLLKGFAGRKYIGLGSRAEVDGINIQA